MENNFGFDYYQYRPMLSHATNLLHTDVAFTSRIIPSFPASDNTQKRFLVFDHSGDKTTLLYSSVAHAPVQIGTYRVPIPPAVQNLKEKIDGKNCSTPNSNSGNIENHSGDEMHENTEELDALLYSDDDSDFPEDDETSTGHSPGTMTDYEEPNLVEESGDEVNSIDVHFKRRKLSSGASFEKGPLSALESHAESTCKGNLSKRRSRKEKIIETVRIMQSIVPNLNSTDSPIVVIDEAVRFLKSLKDKAKALGLEDEN